MPVVVRASTLATVNAFFSIATAAAAKRSSVMELPRKKAIVDIFDRRRFTASDLCSFDSVHSSVVIFVTAFGNVAKDDGNLILDYLMYRDGLNRFKFYILIFYLNPISILAAIKYVKIERKSMF